MKLIFKLFILILCVTFFSNKYSLVESTKQLRPLFSLEIAQTIVQEENLWISTKFSGIVKLDLTTKKIIHYSTYNSNLASNKIRSITVSEKGNLYVATNEGIQSFNGSNWKSIKGFSIEELKTNIDYIHKDINEGLIIFTSFYVLRLKNGVIYHYPNKFENQSLNEKNGHKGQTFNRQISSHYKDKEGHLYFAGGGYGWIKIINDTARVVTKLGNQSINFHCGKEVQFIPQKQNFDFILGNSDNFLKIKGDEIQEFRSKSNSIFSPSGDVWYVGRRDLTELIVDNSKSNSNKYKYSSTVLESPNGEIIRKAFFDKENNLYLITDTTCFRKKKKDTDFKIVGVYNQFLPRPDFPILPISEYSFWIASIDELQYVQLNEEYKIKKIVKERFPFRIKNFSLSKESTVVFNNDYFEYYEIEIDGNQKIKASKINRDQNIQRLLPKSNGNGIWMVVNETLIDRDSVGQEKYHQLVPRVHKIAEQNGRIYFKAGLKGQTFELVDGQIKEIIPPEGNLEISSLLVDFKGRIYSYRYPNLMRREDGSWAKLRWLKTESIFFTENHVYEAFDHKLIKYDYSGNRLGAFQSENFEFHKSNRYTINNKIYLINREGLLVLDEKSFQ